MVFISFSYHEEHTTFYCKLIEKKNILYIIFYKNTLSYELHFQIFLEGGGGRYDATITINSVLSKRLKVSFKLIR